MNAPVSKLNNHDTMKLWLPVCSKSVVLTCTVAISLALSGGVPQFVQAKAKNNQVQDYLDFSTVHQKYTSGEAAERAL